MKWTKKKLAKQLLALAATALTFLSVREYEWGYFVLLAVGIAFSFFIHGYKGILGTEDDTTNPET